MILTIGFSSPKKFKIGSALIKFWQRTDYSHVYLSYYDDRLKKTMVFHAANGVVHNLPYDTFLISNKVINSFDLNIDKTLEEFLIESSDLLGVVYGYSELLKIVTYDVLKNLGITFITYNGKGYICSELIATILEKYFNKKFNKPKHLLTTKDIFLWLE